MKNLHEGGLDFDDMELMQLEFYVNEMEKNCSMGGEIRRHESIYHKIKKNNPDEFLLNLTKKH